MTIGDVAGRRGERFALTFASNGPLGFQFRLELLFQGDLVRGMQRNLRAFGKLLGIGTSPVVPCPFDVPEKLLSLIADVLLAHGAH